MFKELVNIIQTSSSFSFSYYFFFFFFLFDFILYISLILLLIFHLAHMYWCVYKNRVSNVLASLMSQYFIPCICLWLCEYFILNCIGFVEWLVARMIVFSCVSFHSIRLLFFFFFFLVFSIFLVSSYRVGAFVLFQTHTKTSFIHTCYSL